MIDRSLNYGRAQMAALAGRCRDVHAILDLGAGLGVDLMNIKTLFPGAVLHGIECHPPAVAELQAKGIIVHSLNLEKERIPLASESCDLVITNQFLEHTKEIFWILHEVSRVLRVGGHLLVGVPNLASLHNRLLLLIGRQPTSIQTASAHIRGFTRPDFLEFLKACFPHGYALEACRGSNFYPFPPFVAKPLARVFPSMAWSIFMLFEKREAYLDSFVEFPGREHLETNYFGGP